MMAAREKTRPEPAAPAGARHVGIIMDGNGRWAAARGLPRVMGHRKGVEAVRRTVEAAGELGVEYLTLYSFSTENWKRPETEVRDLMGLLRQYVHSDLKRLHENGVRVRILGDRETLSDDLVALINECEEKTRNNTRLNLLIAFNYGGRDEILRAARRLAERAATGCMDAAAITEAVFDDALDTVGIPDPDLIIRTSGEKRVSNFLLWQAAYAEYVFLDVAWPDFDKSSLQAALEEFAGRVRRFGGVDAETAG